MGTRLPAQQLPLVPTGERRGPGSHLALRPREGPTSGSTNPLTTRGRYTSGTYVGLCRVMSAREMFPSQVWSSLCEETRWLRPSQSQIDAHRLLQISPSHQMRTGLHRPSGNPRGHLEGTSVRRSLQGRPLARRTRRSELPVSGAQGAAASWWETIRRDGVGGRRNLEGMPEPCRDYP